MVTPNPLKLIEAIRDSTPYMHLIYTHGSCYHLFNILKTVYPDAIAYYRYSYEDSHVITRIGRKYYDINGEVKDTSRYMPFDEAHFPAYTHFANKWWCKFHTLAKVLEEAMMKPKDLEKWPMQ